MTEFHQFAEAINSQYKTMTNGELFKVEIEDLYNKYLESFPEGTNPIFRTRTEHDCSMCKQFIRNIGNTVALDTDGSTIITVWDDLDISHPYDTVAAAMSEIVKNGRIVSVLRTQENRYGKDFTVELDKETQKTTRWSHFYADILGRHQSSNPGEAKGFIEASVNVLQRGLDELDMGDLQEILSLIDTNSIYRGEEHRDAIVNFIALKEQYDNAGKPKYFAWANANNPAARFKNTVIGSLAEDLSKGMFITDAVKSFEKKVAPANYKRPSALITPTMVSKAMETLRGLDLESAVERRYACLEDVSVTDVLWTDGEVRPLMKGGIEGMLLEEAEKQRPSQDFESLKLNATPIGMEEFLEHIVPESSSVQVLLENTMLGNFMSLTAPTQPDTGNLFKWGNDFGWSYDGDVTDSIAQKVKTAGGNIDAELRVSLAWSNTDDLDIHAEAPEGHVSYSSPRGILDVDMNVGSPLSTEPVENLSWTNPKKGLYRVRVHNYTRRGNADQGFILELAAPGMLQQFSCDTNPPNQTWHDGDIVFKYDKKVGVTNLTVSGLAEASKTVTKWGLQTGQLVPVDVLLASPNHWGENRTGNKHWFFILKDCINPGEARGIYNEFLRSDLEKHRKVFEVLGAKTKCPPSETQLSGVGFSSTMGSEVLVVADHQAYNIKF